MRQMTLEKKKKKQTLTSLAIELGSDECMGQADLGTPKRGNVGFDNHTIPDFIHFWHSES